MVRQRKEEIMRMKNQNVKYLNESEFADNRIRGVTPQKNSNYVSEKPKIIRFGEDGQQKYPDENQFFPTASSGDRTEDKAQIITKPGYNPYLVTNQKPTKEEQLQNKNMNEKPIMQRSITPNPSSNKIYDQDRYTDKSQVSPMPISRGPAPWANTTVAASGLQTNNNFKVPNNTTTFYNTYTPKNNDFIDERQRVSVTTPTRNTKPVVGYNTTNQISRNQGPYASVQNQSQVTPQKISQFTALPDFESKNNQSDPSLNKSIIDLSDQSQISRRRDVTPNKSRITDMGPPGKASSITESRIVERRNSVYSYSGEKESFLEKIVNDEYREAMDTMTGLRKYINECRKQIGVAKDLKMKMLTQPYTGTQVFLAPKTNSNTILIFLLVFTGELIFN